MYLPKAEFDSDIQCKSSNELLGKRKRKPKAQFNLSSEEEEENEEEEEEEEEESQIKKMKVIPKTKKACVIPESLSRKASNFERAKEIFENFSLAPKKVVSMPSTSTPPTKIVPMSSGLSPLKKVISKASSSSLPKKIVPRGPIL